MNINDVAKREILDFKEFLGKVMDDTYKPFDSENQKDSYDRTGLHKIKREPAYDYAGYADAVFDPSKAGIEVPGYNAGKDREYINAIGGAGLPQDAGNGIRSVMDTSESQVNESIIIRLKDFK
jgi:hypothetical protein